MYLWIFGIESNQKPLNPTVVALQTAAAFDNLPREDSDAEEDLLTLNAGSESLSSGLLL